MIQSMRPVKLLTILGVALLALAWMAPASPAAETAEGYEQFENCPTQEEVPQVEICFVSEITGGHFQMGNKDVPIENPFTLSGGFDGGVENFYVGESGGIEPVKQKVPGGVVGLTGLTWLFEFFGSDALTLYAVTELAGDPIVGLNDVFLPIKVHLINPLLGSSCYVGSDSNPILLKLTTGTTNPPPPNEPISGQEGELFFDFEKEIIGVENGIFVDNSFAAPGANGCKLHFFFIPISINGLVNNASGLPSAAGTNETVQNFKAELVEASLVYP